MAHLHHTMVSRSRAKLAAVLNAAGDVVRVGDAATTLGISRVDAAKSLARWTEQGWLRRVGRGAYVSVPVELSGSAQVVGDPWMLVPTLFGPAYVGGWSAAEYWDLTEQIFREILVFSARPLRSRQRTIGGTEFVLRQVAPDRLFGLQAVWRAHTKVMVSDIDRTMVDLLDDPSAGGGIQHVADCFGHYVRHKERRKEKLIEYAERLNNGAVFKRLGFLSESHPEAEDLLAQCKARLTKGHAKLDPGLEGNRLVTRWKLRIPDSWATGGGHDQ